MADIRPETAHTFHGRAEVKSEVGTTGNAKFSAIPRIMKCPGRPDNTLGGDAADIEAVTSHQMPFDEGDLCPQSGGSGCRYQSSRTATDDNQVVARCRFRVDPVRGVNTRCQLPVLRGIRQDSVEQCHGAFTNFIAAEFMQ